MHHHSSWLQDLVHYGSASLVLDIYGMTRYSQLNSFPSQIRLLAYVFVSALLGIQAACSNNTIKANSNLSVTSARNEIIMHALSMLGTPYRYGGNDRQGFDCSGLVNYSYQNAGITIPRTTRLQFSASQTTHKKRLQPGDVVFFKLNGRGIDHVGIYLGDGDFIHAPSTGKQVQRSNLDKPYWRDRYYQGGSFL